MVASHASCAFSFGASERLRDGVGRRLPVNIWIWAGSGAGVGQSQGSQAGEVGAPPGTGLGRLSMCSPPPSQHKTMVKTKTDAQEGGTAAQHLGQRRASNREACGNPSPKSLELREGTGEPRIEKGEKQLAGTGGERGPLAPIFLRGWGWQSQRWPILPGPLPLRRGRSPSGYS